MARVHRGDGGGARGARARRGARCRCARSIRGAGAAGMLGLMPAYRGGEEPRLQPQGGLRLPRQPARWASTPTRASSTLFDGETGRPTAILNGSRGDRDPHRGGHGARDARCWRAPTRAALAMIGSGVQARGAPASRCCSCATSSACAIFSPTAGQRASALAASSRERFAGGPCVRGRRRARARRSRAPTSSCSRRTRRRP